MQLDIKVEEIREHGLDLDRELTHEFLEAAFAEESELGFHAVGNGHFHGHFDRLPGRVLLSAHVDLEYRAPCKRCLAEVVCKDPIDFRMTFVHERPDVQKALEDAGFDEAESHELAKGSFDKDDVDLEPFDGETIALAPTVREQILLSLPMDILCKDSCKGLCTVCGQDLNERECGHDRTVRDPRWSALKDLKLPN